MAYSTRARTCVEGVGPTLYIDRQVCPKCVLTTRAKRNLGHLLGTRLGRHSMHGPT